ncbi:hypothetical protein PsorP6_007690 [Peronosclerospora sorghi]|uniref:Uncharacterized protein n=1 Tax=Peronosclerospora sorghi TaxID=230839 RepID=A0ACC0WAN9_9STRA|nr:hypothetical protein PsorP6_007690 [Peronosclerospora sorghi]
MLHINQLLWGNLYLLGTTLATSLESSVVSTNEAVMVKTNGTSSVATAAALPSAPISVLPLLVEYQQSEDTAKLFPKDQIDNSQQQVDLRTSNSWVKKINQIENLGMLVKWTARRLLRTLKNSSELIDKSFVRPYSELVEVFTINTMAPFIFNKHKAKLLLFLTEVVEKKGNKMKAKSNDNSHPVPLSVKSYQAYISALVQMMNAQLSLKMHSNPHSNGIALKSFIKSLKRKETTRPREAFEDRGVNNLADGYTVKDMMTLHHHYMSASSGNQMRNRADLLIAHMILMRGESRRMPQRLITSVLEHVQPCYTSCTRARQTKIESGTAMRSKSPELCAIGAIDFYLFYRFHIEK